MSDMPGNFYNAWISVMNAAAMRLFCSWHVNRAWRKNLKKIRSQVRQVEAYKLLRTLLEERDVNAFHKLLKCGLEFLKKDFETEVFVLYFEEKYAKNLKVWAYCYHLHVGLNTNMHIERMHKSIKYIYLKGKNVKRLDKTLNVMMIFIPDKLVGRLITIY